MMQNLPFQDDKPSSSAPWKMERLDSWKEVASFFQRDVRTVQLWEKHEGLPVRRHQHRKLGSVYAYRAELERWWAARSAMRAGTDAATAGVPTAAERAPAPNPESLAGKPHVLVLPFEAVRSNSDSTSMRQAIDRFGVGLQDDLVVELSRLKMYSTNLPSRAMPQMDAPTPTFMKTLAAEFAAEMVLTGAIRLVGNQVRVSAQLIRAGDLRCLWADRFDVDLAGVHPTKLEESQKALAGRLGEILLEYSAHGGAPRRQPPAARQSLAHCACTMGRHFWNQRSRTAIQKAFGYFLDAVDLDPRCAEAYAGLANSYVSLSYNHLMPPREAAVRAVEAVRAAMRIAPESISVRNARINVLTNCEWDWSTAESECRALLDLGRMDGRTIQLYSSLMNAQGRHEEAIGMALHAHRLEPDSTVANTQVSLAYLYGGDCDSALPFIQRALELTPHYIMGQALLGRIEAGRGNWDDAASAFSRTLELSDQSSFAKALMAYARAGSGDVTSARAILRDLDEVASDKCFPAYDVSAAHSILNQHDKALENISRACDSRDMKAIFVNHDPRFAGLRDSPGFRQIASAMPFN
jgi:TolB-like protein/tetratricopeptide (TPR) repeat protein